MTLPAGAHLGPFEVVSLIGEDDGVEIYRAKDTRLPREVTIKTLPRWLAENAARRARYERDMRTIARLNHPNIRRVYDIGEQDGIAFLVVEHLAGESLDERLRSGALSWRTALAIGVQVAGALDAAHKAGIVHRELKPANVMLVGSSVKLLDFGNTALIEPSESEPSANLTTERQLRGAPSYMAPEQLEGREVDARSDIFALGAMLYEMIAGRKAFDGDNTASVTTAVMTATPLPISDGLKRSSGIPRGLNRIVQRALSKRPEDRWRTAGDLGHELQWILDSDVRAAAALVSADRRRRVVQIGLVAAVLLGIGATIGRFALRPKANATPVPMMHPITFAVTPPEGTHFDRSYASLAVSPDGRQIVFVATENGKSSLWRRAVGETDAIPIPDTDGAEKPFWSPDSESIGFFANSGTAIRIVGIADRRSRQVGKLVQPSNTSNASWLADNTIVFAEGADLKRLPASGGAVTSLKTVGAQASALSNLGNGLFFYLVNHAEAVRTFSGQIDGRAGPPIVLPSVESNAFLASGYLIFRQDAALVAQKFDEPNLALIGKPIVLVGDVDYDPATAETVFAVSPTVLAYRQVPRTLTWIDRSGQRMGSFGDERDGDPSIARNGADTVAVDRGEGRSHRIWTMDGRGPAAQPFDRDAEGSAPVWSRDGLWLAFRRETAAGTTLYKARVSGAPEEKALVDVAGEATPLDWSLKNQLLYSVDSDLWTYDLETRKTEQQTKLGTIEKGARFSPNGKWLAYSAREPGGRISLWVKSLADGQMVRASISDGFDPSWRGDGRELYYMTGTGELMAASFDGSATPVVGTPTRLFQIDPRDIRNPVHVFAATSDGQRFLVSEPSDREAGITVIVNWLALLR